MGTCQLKGIVDTHQVETFADAPANAPDFLHWLVSQKGSGSLRVTFSQRQNTTKLPPLLACLLS